MRAADNFDVPVAMVSLVDHDHQIVGGAMERGPGISATMTTKPGAFFKVIGALPSFSADRVVRGIAGLQAADDLDQRRHRHRLKKCTPLKRSAREMGGHLGDLPGTLPGPLPQGLGELHGDWSLLVTAAHEIHIG
jgi:hypothetical protein